LRPSLNVPAAQSAQRRSVAASGATTTDSPATQARQGAQLVALSIALNVPVVQPRQPRSVVGVASTAT
jgi:hypothetical protein